MTDNIRYWDKMLPVQKEYSNLYRGSALTQGLFDLICRSSGIGDPKLEFALEQSDLFTIEEMGSNPIAMRFLQFLIKVAGVRRVLEIGTFIGFSAMSFAQALPEDGEVVTIEAFDRFAAVAKRNIAKNGFDGKITVHTGDAFAVIHTLPRDELFDLVFIDGNKERYKDYAVKAEPLLSRKGIIIVDDCFFHGDALNPQPVDAKGAGAKAFLNHAAASDGWLRIALPISNGIFLMVRK